eukprot:TRINITY_DN39439_c0_g1_i20.p1 TRINITY_DN39439_c0_g1~~TRINITY_DN39439_c0_g1_i20.p1  ORF type:complete len:608 (-),score=51.96 TRINITY_DN39439_c0_g1_i20:2128-3951(-)
MIVFRLTTYLLFCLLCGIAAFMVYVYSHMLHHSHNAASSLNLITLQLEYEKQLLPEIWARGPPPTPPQVMQQASALLSEYEKKDLRDLCGRCLYHTLHNAMTVTGIGDDGFVQTGDIALMWIRDGAIQLGVYLPRIKKHPSIRYFVEGAIRRMAYMILQDPYANAYECFYKSPTTLPQSALELGRAGYVGTRNYEVDSGAYFMNLLWNYYTTESLYRPEQFLQDRLFFDSVNLMVDIWIIEQSHFQQSSYQYIELPNKGIGTLAGYTGMTWSGYRPSDDPQQYGYHIPGNMYAAGALRRMLMLNKHVWGRNMQFERKAHQLLMDIEKGIQNWGLNSSLIDDNYGVSHYVYEVDGLGSQLFMDDANVPSLLSIPLLGYEKYDKIAYQQTRERVLSLEFNKYYFEGSSLQGEGSPHTPSGYVWPIGLIVQALTSNNAIEIQDIVQQLLKTQCNNGLMHESIYSSNVKICTREWFEWANVMLVVLTENLLGVDCEDYIKYTSIQKYYNFVESMVDQIPGENYNNWLLGNAYDSITNKLVKVGGLPPKYMWGKWNQFQMLESQPTKTTAKHNHTKVLHKDKQSETVTTPSTSKPTNTGQSTKNSILPSYGT